LESKEQTDYTESGVEGWSQFEFVVVFGDGDDTGCDLSCANCKQGVLAEFSHEGWTTGTFN